jgi:hypothetical protein
MLFVLGIPLDFGRQGNHFDQAVFPVSAADWLERQPQTGAMFNYFPWGGYLLYRFWPSERVFIDGQTDFYGERLTRQYEQVITLAGGWQNVLSRYRVDWVMVASACRSGELGERPPSLDRYLFLYEVRGALDQP